MLTHLLVIALVAYLIHREKKSIHGSPMLMGVVMIAIFFGGFMGSGYLLIDRVSQETMVWLDTLLIFLWFGVGYGVYWAIRTWRDNAYQRRLDAELSK